MALKPERIFRGNGVSPGIVLGQALKIDSHNRLIMKIHVADVEEENGKLNLLKASTYMFRNTNTVITKASRVSFPLRRESRKLALDARLRISGMTEI